RQGATVDQGMIVSLFPVNAIWVNSYFRVAIHQSEIASLIGGQMGLRQYKGGCGHHLATELG
ncbi:hypothetical protein, partial [Aeromonas hydrophila]